MSHIAQQSGMFSIMLGEGSLKHYTLNPLERVFCQVFLRRGPVYNSRTHSLMRRIIAVGNTAQWRSLFYTLGTQRSNTVVAQQACRSSCDSPPEELAVDATLPTGITSSAHLRHSALV